MVLVVTFALLALSGPPEPADAQPVAVVDARSVAGSTDPSPQAEVLLITAAVDEPAADDGQRPGGNGGEDAEKPPTPPHTGIHALLDGLWLDIKNLPSLPNLDITLIGGGAAFAVHPWDQTFNARLMSHYDVVNDVFAPAKYYGGTPVQIALSIGTYAVGRISGKPKVSHLGMDLLRAQAISELIVQPLKYATHRERPDGSDYQSFPSGHAAATFAAATVIERHLGWKGAAIGYGIASYVAASRLHDNVHNVSDVVFGSAVGIIAGRTVTEHGREKWTLTPAFVPGGVAVVVMRNP
jgi:membrane-associated phospholipid phosphatase